jgi:8-oxo-dGDP phosphatase
MRWIVHGERPLYATPWVGLHLVDVEIPGGERFEHHVVRVPSEAAGCVVYDPDRGVLLLWRHRFITDTWGWEIPAGGIDDGETAASAAVREVLEDGVATRTSRAPRDVPTDERFVRPAVSLVPRAGRGAPG